MQMVKGYNIQHEKQHHGQHQDEYDDDEDGSSMMIRPDEEQHRSDYDGNEEEYGDEDEDDEENCIEIDERTLIAIIKVQALIRGFLTRKMIFEHLQRMVQENQMMMYQEQNDYG